MATFDLIAPEMTATTALVGRADRCGAPLTVPTAGTLRLAPPSGTGLRTSVMLHLPALALRTLDERGRGGDREIVRMHNAAQELGLTVRGLFGESSRAEGDFFQISNQITLGRSPAQTIDDVRELVSLVVAWERRNREAQLRDDRKLRAWNTDSGEMVELPLAELAGSRSRHVSPDGRRVAR